MICEPCLKGGYWNVQWRLTKDSTFLASAEAGHGDCVGKDRCVCQHAVGSDSLKVVSDVK